MFHAEKCCRSNVSFFLEATCNRTVKIAEDMTWEQLNILPQEFCYVAVDAGLKKDEAFTLHIHNQEELKRFWEEFGDTFGIANAAKFVKFYAVRIRD